MVLLWTSSMSSEENSASSRLWGCFGVFCHFQRNGKTACAGSQGAGSSPERGRLEIDPNLWSFPENLGPSDLPGVNWLWRGLAMPCPDPTQSRKTASRAKLLLFHDVFQDHGLWTDPEAALASPELPFPPKNCEEHRLGLIVMLPNSFHLSSTWKPDQSSAFFAALPPQNSNSFWPARGQVVP